MHARSLDVAFAVRDAVESKVISESVLEPVVLGAAGYWRAVGRLKALTTLLSAAAGDDAAEAPALAVLFIDSGLWSRISASPDGYRLEAHTKGVQSGDIVIVTSESVTAEILEGRTPITVALTRSLLLIDGDILRAQHIRSLLVRALDQARLTASRSAPHHHVNFFGPAR